MKNKVCKWWLITWNWPSNNWQQYIINGMMLEDMQLINKNNLGVIKNRVKRVVAAKEIAPNGMPHIHAVVEFENKIYYSQIRKYFNNVANLKAIKKDLFNYELPIKYIFKSKPPLENYLIFPDNNSWLDYKNILEEFFI